MRRLAWFVTFFVSAVSFIVSFIVLGVSEHHASREWLASQDRYVQVPAVVTSASPTDGGPMGADPFWSMVRTGATEALLSPDGYPAASVVLPGRSVEVGSTRDVFIDTVDGSVVTRSGRPVAPGQPGGLHSGWAPLTGVVISLAALIASVFALLRADDRRAAELNCQLVVAHS